MEIKLRFFSKFAGYIKLDSKMVVYSHLYLQSRFRINLTP